MISYSLRSMMVIVNLRGKAHCNNPGINYVSIRNFCNKLTLSGENGFEDMRRVKMI